MLIKVWSQLQQPSRLNGGHISHVILGGLDNFIVDNPAGRLLCIEDGCWVDVQFMIITDGPWEAEQFCLKYILNTFSKTFPQMHLNSSKRQAVLHINYPLHSIFSRPPLSLQKSRINHAKKGRRKATHGHPKKITNPEKYIFLLMFMFIF